MAKEHLAVIEAQAGIAVDPGTGLFFIGDTDTGMYLTDPGEIMFRADGQDILRVQQLSGDTFVDSMAFETHINRRAIIYSATEAPRLKLDLAALGRAAIEFGSTVAGGDGIIRYFDPTETPGLPSEMQFRVNDESIVHMFADSVEIDGGLTLDGGDLSVDKAGGPTLKLSGMAGSEQGHILFEGQTGSGAIRYTPNSMQFVIHPNAASSTARVTIDTDDVHIRGLELLVDGNPVWHMGNLNPGTFSFTPTLGGNTADPTVTYGTQTGRYARVGPLVFVHARVDWTAISGGSGAVRIRGLDALPTPYTSFAQILPGRATGVDFTTGRTAVYASFPSAGVLQVASYGSNVGTQTISLTHLGSSGSLLFQGVYLTSDPLP